MEDLPQQPARRNNPQQPTCNGSLPVQSSGPEAFINAAAIIHIMCPGTLRGVTCREKDTCAGRSHICYEWRKLIDLELYHQRPETTWIIDTEFFVLSSNKNPVMFSVAIRTIRNEPLLDAVIDYSLSQDSLWEMIAPFALRPNRIARRDKRRSNTGVSNSNGSSGASIVLFGLMARRYPK